MALTYPIGLDILSECLTGPESGALRLTRFDERSGSGDGRFWTAEMAPPLWSASYELYARTPELARKINALVYALDGGQKTMLWADPYYEGPADGALGSLANVTVQAVSANGEVIAFQGLPAGQILRVGDYFSIPHTSGRIYFGTLAEQGAANSSGVLAGRTVRPYAPIGVAAGAPVNLMRPHLKMAVTDYQPFRIQRGVVSSTATITMIQKP